MIHGDAVVVLGLIVVRCPDKTTVGCEEIIPKMVMGMTEVLVLVVFAEDHADHSLGAVGRHAVLGRMV